MKYIHLIYNPESGNKTFVRYLDYFNEVAKSLDVHVLTTRLSLDENIESLLNYSPDECSAIIVAGGDGTVNKVINGMIDKNIDLPLGIIPAGTANDFAVYLKMPKDFKAAIELLPKLKIQQVDVGKVNGSYFINVCAGGGLVNISHNIDQEMKNNFGVFAYYIRGITEFTSLKSKRFIIQSDQVMHEDLLFFILINTSGSGGFNDLVLDAKIDDGYLDFIGFRPCSFNELTSLFTKMLMGQDFKNEKNILYFKTNKLTIDCLDPIDHSNLDGEVGPSFPLDIEVEYRKIRILSAAQ